MDEIGRISAILPVFGERDSVLEIVSALNGLIASSLEEIILIVSPFSPETTLDVCNEAVRRYPNTRISLQRENPGLGFAIRQGIDEANGEHILMMDSDGEMDVYTVPQMLTVLREHKADLVVGSRWVRGGGVEGYDPIKYVLNRGFQEIFLRIYGTSIHDLTLGFKLGRAAVLKSFHWTSQYHDIACETTLRVIRAGHIVLEVPTFWRKRREGLSKNPFRRNFRYVMVAVRVLWSNGRSA